MVGQGSLNLDRLSEPVITANQYGGINIEQVYTGGGNFGVEYTSFKQGTSTALQEMSQQIEDKTFFSLYIETPNGTNIHSGNIQLNARLLKDNEDVTDLYDSQYFTWSRTSNDSYGDIYWNDQHKDGTKNIIITPNDVRINADFQCKFEYKDITVTAG